MLEVSKNPEPEFISQKDFARLKRRRFSLPSSFKYGQCGGKSVGKQVRNRWSTPHASTVECFVSRPVPQDCVDRLKDIHLPPQYHNFSLNKHKGWETYPEELKTAAPAYVRHFPAETSNRASYGNVESTIYVFRSEGRDSDDEDPNGDFHDPEEIDNFSPNYIKDRFSKRIYKRDLIRAYFLKENRRPPKIKEPRIHKLRFSSRSISSAHSDITDAGIAYHRHSIRPRSVWIPRTDYNSSDYLEVDLLRNYIVTAVGTKGRPALWVPTTDYSNRRSGSSWGPGMSTPGAYDVENENHWVSKYALTYKSVEDGNSWRTVGEFRGNFDRSTEVAHRLDRLKGSLEGNEDSDVLGIKARYLRFRPLSREQGGYHGKKALRVAVYGLPFTEKKANEHNPTSDSEQESYLPSGDFFDKSVPGVRVILHSLPNSETTNPHYARRTRKCRGSFDEFKDVKHRRDRRMWKRFCDLEAIRKTRDCFTISIAKPSISWRGFSTLRVLWSKA